MSDQYRTSMIDSTRSLSFDTVTLLTTSTINTLHFPDLSTSGIADSGGSRRTSILLDGIGMCESMTESFCSTGGQDDSTHHILSSDHHHSKIERRDSTKKRRSRKAQYDASIDGTSLDRIEAVHLIDEHNEPDDVWLYEIPKSGQENLPNQDNIFSWVHQEFKTNDINASKHRLLCKLDDMSNARTIRSVSCHNFLNNQRSDSVPRSSVDQQVHSEPTKNGRFSSPLRSPAPLLNGHGNHRPTSPVHPSSLRSNNTSKNATNGTAAALARSRETSRERLDYTDLEVMAKVQLENLRQADRQGPLSKHFGGSSVSLASTSSGTSVGVSNRTGTKPPIAPKSVVVRSNVKPNAYQRSTTQTIVSTSSDAPVIGESKPPVTLKTRISLLPPNSANNNRTRPPTARPLQTYRGAQTTCVASSSTQRNGKTLSSEYGPPYSTKEFSSNENGLLHDVSNRPSTAPARTQVGPQRRTILPQVSAEATARSHPTLPRSSSSSLSQGRKSGIPTVGKTQKPGTATVTRSKPSKSSENLLASETVQLRRSRVSPRPSQRPPSWNDGCY